MPTAPCPPAPAFTSCSAQPDLLSRQAASVSLGTGHLDSRQACLCLGRSCKPAPGAGGEPAPSLQEPRKGSSQEVRPGAFPEAWLNGCGPLLGTQGTETSPDPPKPSRGKGGSPTENSVALHDLDPAVLGGMCQMQAARRLRDLGKRVSCAGLRTGDGLERRVGEDPRAGSALSRRGAVTALAHRRHTVCRRGGVPRATTPTTSGPRPPTPLLQVTNLGPQRGGDWLQSPRLAANQPDKYKSAGTLRGG